MAQVAATRREQLRAQTTAEIKQHALAQVAEGGPEALSLNAISRTMRMSGPALYRYFASRDDLLAELAADGYEGLADAVEAAAAEVDTVASGTDRRQVRGARLRAVASAYRAWVLAYPHLYRLMFASRYGSGLVAPERVVPASQRPMNALVGAVAELGTLPADPPTPEPLVEQLQSWQASRGQSGTIPAGVLHLSVTAWTRVHGLIGLEIEGVFVSMGIDPSLLFDAEIDQIIESGSG